MPHELVSVPPEIPEQYRKTFARLSGEVFWLHEKWHQYNRLFGFSQERIDLLEEGGSFIVTIFHDLLFDDAILGLCRLFDPAESFVKRKSAEVPNLSFWYLKVLLEGNGEVEFARQTKERLDALETKVNALKVHRNKRIGHLDHSAATSEEHTWPAVSRDLIEQTIEGAEACLKEFERHFTKQNIDSWFVPSPGGWEALLTALAKARAYDRLEEQGRIPPNTFRDLGHLDGVE